MVRVHPSFPLPLDVWIFNHYRPYSTLFAERLVNITEVYSPQCPVNHHSLESVTQCMAPSSWSCLLSKWMNALLFPCYDWRLRRNPDWCVAKHQCFFDSSLHILSLVFMYWPLCSFLKYLVCGPRVQNCITWMKIVNYTSIHRIIKLENNLVVFTCILFEKMKN